MLYASTDVKIRLITEDGEVFWQVMAYNTQNPVSGLQWVGRSKVLETAALKALGLAQADLDAGKLQ